MDPYAPARFAVDLFDVGESTIAPGSAAADRGPRDDTGASPAGPPERCAPRPATARDELWVPILLLVLVALCVEWAVYHRDARRPHRRSLGPVGRTPADGST